MKLQCVKCNYKFEKDKIPFRCPYCSVEGAIKEEGTAQDILNEVLVEDQAIEESRQERE